MKYRSQRLGVALVFLALLTFWPPLHMVLAHVTGFAPSRLGGWGMYAGPDEGYTGVEIFVLAPGAVLPPEVLQPASEHRTDGLRFPFEVHLTVVTDDGFRALDGSEMSGEELASLWRDIRRVQAFPGKRSAARLADALRRLELAPGGTSEVLLVAATPGVDPEAGRTHTALRGYVVDLEAAGPGAVDPAAVRTVQAVARGERDLWRLEAELRAHLARGGR